MPQPWSRTLTSAQQSSRRLSRRISPPSGVYLAALSSRISSSWRSSVSSARRNRPSAACSVYVRRVQKPPLLGHLAQAGRKLDRLQVQRLRAAVAAGEEEQVLDQAVHVPGLPEDGRDADVPRLGVVLGPAREQLRVALAAPRAGCAALVRRVLGKVHLPLKGVLHAVEHPVERQGQLAQLVVRLGRRKPRVQRLGVQRVRPGDHA